MPPTILVPSFPAPSWNTLEHTLRCLQDTARSFQVDIVDGQFVPHLSWPFTEPDPIKALAALTAWSNVYLLEIDCMVNDPLAYLDAIVSVGAQRVIVHMGSTDNYNAVFAHRAMYGYQLGFALTNDVPLSELKPFLPELSFVQLMGIAHVGQQGQPFDSRTLDRVRELRQEFPELDIAVDGSVNAATIPSLLAAGVNRFAPGSAITQADDPVVAYKQLCELIAC